jgi:hypothetical protein
VHEFEQVEYRCTALKRTRFGIDVLGFAHERKAGGLAARVELDPQGLERTGVCLSVDESDHKRQDTMHASATAFEQQPRPLLATRHQWVATAIQYKNRHEDSSSTTTGMRPVRVPLRAL